MHRVQRMAAGVAGFRDFFTFDTDQTQIYSAAIPQDCRTVWQNVNVCMCGMTASREYWNSKRGHAAPPPPPFLFLQEELHYCTKGQPDVTKIRKLPRRKLQILVQQPKWYNNICIEHSYNKVMTYPRRYFSATKCLWILWSLFMLRKFCSWSQVRGKWAQSNELTRGPSDLVQRFHL
jgi:hypothetical protein